MVTLFVNTVRILLVGSYVAFVFIVLTLAAVYYIIMLSLALILDRGQRTIRQLTRNSRHF